MIYAPNGPNGPNQKNGPNAKKGKVYLIGAGPGDPKLLTLRGRECIQEADVVVYDYLANDQLLLHARAGAEIIYAGKRRGEQAISQRQINDLMVDRARKGLVVARLKGGDPFIFGRGGEEAIAMADAGVPFEMVPGVTSASGVPAYAGIPLTHRDYSATVILTTAHEDPSKPHSSIPWEQISPGKGTLVFFMGITNLRSVVDNLIKYGRNPQTPVAIICWGTRPEQETVVGVLDNIIEEVHERHLALPGMIIVGDVVRLREKLNWFESRPLFGKRILVTRPEEQASELSDLLSRFGAEPVEIPTIQVVPMEDWTKLDHAISQVGSYDWIIFTSVNGVRFFRERLWAREKDVRSLKTAKVCTIGPKTAEAVRQLGIIPDLIPSVFQAEGIVEEMKNIGVDGKRILLPRAEQAREILPESLRSMGAQVDVVPAYRNIKPVQHLERIRSYLKDQRISVVTFTSSSAVTNFIAMFEPKELILLMKSVIVASIGPITANTVREAGLSNHIMPKEYTVPALAQSIVDYFKRQ
jgi:uroporphyrinogen III methyltransferase / synthase